MTRLHRLGVFALAIFLLSTPAFAASSGDIASLVRGPQGLLFQDLANNQGGSLVVTGPEGFVSRSGFAASSSLSFEVTPGMADGAYTWELVLFPKLNANQRRSMDQIRKSGDEAAAERINREQKLEPLSGYFTILDGAMVSDDLVESSSAPSGPISSGLEANGSDLGSMTGEANFTNVNGAAQVFVTDVVIQGSTCTGFDCVNGESFGFDTLRLKENNLRVHFQDTSNSGSFPSNDWRLVANETSNGGANMFAIEDSTAGRNPFTIEAGAIVNSLYVDASGDIGLGTSTPVVEVQAVDGNTPTLRLEQNGSSGFTAQTFDIAANEANFFIRDVTNGSKLPFRIEPDAPTNSLFVSRTGHIGLGTNSPGSDHELVIRTTDRPNILLDDPNEPIKWEIRRSGSGFAIINDTDDTDFVLFDSGIVRMGAVNAAGSESFLLQANGDLAIAGDLTARGIVTASDVNLKQDFSEVDGGMVLDKIASLPVSSWAFKSAPGVRHIGPMAQDFQAAFGLGDRNTHITLSDLGGISLAAIQELHKQLEEKTNQLETLESQNKNLLERLEALEAKLAE